MRTAWQVTLYVNVHDPKQVHADALAHMLANGSTRSDAFDMLGTKRAPDMGACLRMLLDPGQAPSLGMSIEDSTTEGGDSLD